MTRRLFNTRRRDLHSGQERAERPLPRSRAVLGCAVATVLLAVGVAPANADRLEWTDPAGDMTAVTESSDETTLAPAPGHHAGDFTSAVLRHGRRAVTINFTFAELRSHFNAFYGKLRAGDVTRHYFVHDEVDARPRLYVLNKRHMPACGEATLDVDYRANTLTIRVPRKCLIG
jgi:hypothetical protein